MAEIACRYCGEVLVNSYFLIQHITTDCPVLHPPGGQHPPDHGGDWPPRPEHHRHHHHHNTKEFWYSWAVPIPKGRKKYVIQMATFIMKDSDPPATATVGLTDEQGQPTTPDIPAGQPGGPLWAESSGGTVVALTSSDDGMTGFFKPVAVGTSNYTWTATDNDGTQLVGTGSIQVDPGEARNVSISIVAGSATP